MSWAAKSCPDAERDIPEKPMARRKLLRREPRKIDFKLTAICEEGAYFCPRCIKYQMTIPNCGRCGREMIWHPPIF